MDDISAELELIPLEKRAEFENKQIHSPESEILQSALHDANGKMRVNHPDGFIYEYTLFVTFYQGYSKKVVEIKTSSQGPFLERIAKKAHEVFPSSEWLICAGDENKAYFEFTDDRQLKALIKQSRFYNFDYIFIRLEPVTRTIINDHDARCDQCGQPIHGHRYKCTQCPDFDICQQCEAKSLHLEHAMLRIVNRKFTEIPRYITDNAPRNFFENY